MKKNLIYIVMTLLFMIGQSQDTVVPLHYVKIVDENMLHMMDSVMEHASKCSILKELPCCYVCVEKIVDKEYGEMVQFVTRPYNESLLVLDAYIWGCDSWAIAWNNELPYLFKFLDTSLFEVLEVVEFHIEVIYNEIQYYYEYEASDHTSQLPLEQCEVYDKDTCRLIFRSPCIDISNMTKKRLSSWKILYSL